MSPLELTVSALELIDESTGTHRESTGTHRESPGLIDEFPELIDELLEVVDDSPGTDRSRFFVAVSHRVIFAQNGRYFLAAATPASVTAVPLTFSFVRRPID